jgi:hypothetical protein
MTKQPQPSAEALEAAQWLFHQGERTAIAYEDCDDIARVIDRFAERICEQRVYAETERCAQVALEYRDEADAGRHPSFGDPDHSMGKGYAANLIAKRIRAPAERPAPPPLPNTWARTPACNIQEDGFCTTHQTANMAECANAEMRPAPVRPQQQSEVDQLGKALCKLQGDYNAVVSALQEVMRYYPTSQDAFPKYAELVELRPSGQPRPTVPPTGRVELGERSNIAPQPETLETWAAGLSLAEVARIEAEAFLRGRAVGEKYGPQISQSATPPSPPAVVDYTERARLFANQTYTGPDAYARYRKALADEFSAVASEHQAEIARLRKELAEVGDEAGRLAAQYQALLGIIDSLRVADDANAKAALLARLREPGRGIDRRRPTRALQSRPPSRQPLHIPGLRLLRAGIARSNARRPRRHYGEADMTEQDPRDQTGMLRYYGIITDCRSASDGDCFWKECPQLRDGEPHKTGRHCPLDIKSEDR